MSTTLPRVSTTLLAAAALSVIALPVCAQGFDVKPPKSNEPQTIIDPSLKRGYTIRVTTGARTTAGWEKSLTDGDPNLRHWTWMPVTNYDQAYRKVAPGAYLNNKEREPQYTKNTSSTSYTKPKHVPLPQRAHTWHAPAPAPVVAKSNSRSSGEVTGKVRPFYQGPAYTYGNSGYGQSQTQTAASLASKDVYGKLVSKGSSTK